MDFCLKLDATASRLLQLSLELDRAELGTGNFAEFFMPVWTPGSYLVREYARQITSFSAEDGDSGQALTWLKPEKNRYRVELTAETRRLRLDYRIYAHDLSVRGAFADRDFAYWNGAAVLLWPLGLEDQPARFKVDMPAGWDFHCGLRHEREDFGSLLQFTDLDQAVDTPCLAGSDLQAIDFEAVGRAHRLVLCGLEGFEPPQSFQADCQAIVEEAAAVFGDAPPYADYCFLCLFAERGRGGLEHANSSTLLAPRSTFAPPSEYQEFLSLVAHEHFHVWNGKRMRPTELWDFDYETENYTDLLWAVEGITAYYDDYICMRAGVMSTEGYLKVLAGHVSKMINMPGRKTQSLCDASFDAWIRFYRPDENSLNSTQNYYSNGALAAFCIDARIRSETGGDRSLDDALRELYASSYGRGRGYGLVDISRCLNNAAGCELGDFVSELVQGPFDPDLKGALRGYGLMIATAEKPQLQIGVQLQRGELRIAKVLDGRPAHAAGLAPDDEILAINDLRVGRENYANLFAQLAALGEELRILIARRGKVQEFAVQPVPSPNSGLEIKAMEDVSEDQLAARNSWLRSRAGSRRQTPRDSLGV